MRRARAGRSRVLGPPQGDDSRGATLGTRLLDGDASSPSESGTLFDPGSNWPSRDDYFRKYDALAARFIESLERFKDG